MKKSRIPRPGSAVRGSTGGRPIMALLDLLGRRWALRVIWELRDRKRLNFRQLLAATGTSPGVLNTRLAELREVRVVDHIEAAGYGLTREGTELLSRLKPLNEWAEGWAKRQRSLRRHSEAR